MNDNVNPFIWVQEEVRKLFLYYIPVWRADFPSEKFISFNFFEDWLFLRMCGALPTGNDNEKRD